MTVELWDGAVKRVDGISKVTLAEMRSLFSSSEEMRYAAENAEARAEQFRVSSRTMNQPKHYRTYWAGQASRWRAIAKALRFETPKAGN